MLQIERTSVSVVPGRPHGINAVGVSWRGTALLVVLLAGCAGQPSRVPASATMHGDKNAASQLYAGQPTIVHATEFPVVSAAEGIQRGDEAWRAGKLDLGVYLYVQALAFDASSPGPFLKIGAIHEQLGKRALAEKAYELALEREPGNAATCERLGLLYLQSVRADEAGALFERAVSLEPNRWRSHNGLGILADRRKDYAAAIAHYDRALEIEPKAAPVMNNRGYSRFLAGDPASAEADLKEAIRLGARDGAWTNLGKVQASQARYDDALESFLKAMDVPHAYNLLGEAAMESGDYSLARKYFTSANDASSRYFEEAQKNLSLVNERLAQPAEQRMMVVRSDSFVYSKGIVIGMVRKGLRVPVLTIQDAHSLVKFRDLYDTDLVGWVSSEALTEHL
jgi:tetratricopeptide (TPR) repeat protein